MSALQRPRAAMAQWGVVQGALPTSNATSIGVPLGATARAAATPRVLGGICLSSPAGRGIALLLWAAHVARVDHDAARLASGLLPAGKDTRARTPNLYITNTASSQVGNHA